MKKVFFALMCVAMMALVSSCAKSKTEIVLEELQAAKHRQIFHLDLFPSKSTEYYEYAGIAVEWYRNGK